MDTKKIETATTRDYLSLRGKSEVVEGKKTSKSIFDLPEKSVTE